MPSPKDEFDDAFFAFVGDLVERVTGLEKALQYIKDNLGQVCPEFEVCSHASCNASCTSWLIAEQVLQGRYALPGDPVPTQEDRQPDHAVQPGE